MRLGTFEKQPGERRSYTITYEDVLHAGDNLKSVTLKSVVPEGLVVDQVTNLDPRLRFYADEGVDKTNYKLTFVILTEDGERFEDEVVIKVKEKS